jgi:hypothetical protein
VSIDQRFDDEGVFFSGRGDQLEAQLGGERGRRGVVGCEQARVAGHEPARVGAEAERREITELDDGKRPAQLRTGLSRGAPHVARFGHQACELSQTIAALGVTRPKLELHPGRGRLHDRCFDVDDGGLRGGHIDHRSHGWCGDDGGDGGCARGEERFAHEHATRDGDGDDDDDDQAVSEGQPGSSALAHEASLGTPDRRGTCGRPVSSATSLELSPSSSRRTRFSTARR